MLILKKKDIIKHVDLNEDLIPIIEEAFTSLSKGETVMPPIMRIDIEKFHGESDVKAAYIDGLDSFAIKIASGFFDNPKLGLPSSNGLMVLLDSQTGVIKSILLVTQDMTNIIKKLAINLALLMRPLSIVANTMSAGEKSIICLRTLSRLRLI